MIYEIEIGNKQIDLEGLLYHLNTLDLAYDLLFAPTWDSEKLYLNYPSVKNLQDLQDAFDSYSGGVAPTALIRNLYPENEGSDFRDLDYTIKNLFPKRFFIRGELQKVEWYLESAFQTLVLTTSYTYVRDSFGFATSRSSIRVWKNTDGSDNFYIKTSVKFYSYLETIQEGKTRRANIVNAVQLPVFGFLQEAAIDPQNPYGLVSQTVLLLGREFMDHLEPFFQKFIDNSSSVTDTQDPNFGRKQIVVEFERMAANEASWLNYAPQALGGQVTILLYLTSEFSI